MPQIKDRSYIRAHTFDWSNYRPGFQVELFHGSLLTLSQFFRNG